MIGPEWLLRVPVSPPTQVKLIAKLDECARWKMAAATESTSTLYGSLQTMFYIIFYIDILFSFSQETEYSVIPASARLRVSRSTKSAGRHRSD
jgi:hypothetical protein